MYAPDVFRRRRLLYRLNCLFSCGIRHTSVEHSIWIEACSTFLRPRQLTILLAFSLAWKAWMSMESHTCDFSFWLSRFCMFWALLCYYAIAVLLWFVFQVRFTWYIIEKQFFSEYRASCRLYITVSRSLKSLENSTPRTQPKYNSSTCRVPNRQVYVTTQNLQRINLFDLRYDVSCWRCMAQGDVMSGATMVHPTYRDAPVTCAGSLRKVLP